MKKKINIFFTFIILCFTPLNIAKADPSFIDFSRVLNESKAGKEAQIILKKRLETQISNFRKQEENLKKTEMEIISQKKIIDNKEYQKKVEDLRKKVASMQSKKQKSFNDIGALRTKAKTDLLKKLNPIIKKYMEENNVRIVIDKKSILMGDAKLEITDQIIAQLNKELTSLNIK